LSSRTSGGPYFVYTIAFISYLQGRMGRAGLMIVHSV
jgi:hypothetical protein